MSLGTQHYLAWGPDDLCTMTNVKVQWQTGGLTINNVWGSLVISEAGLINLRGAQCKIEKQNKITFWKIKFVEHLELKQKKKRVDYYRYLGMIK